MLLIVTYKGSCQKLGLDFLVFELMLHLTLRYRILLDRFVQLGEVCRSVNLQLEVRPLTFFASIAKLSVLLNPTATQR